MFIHAFGAYFGLAVSLMHRNRNVASSEALEGSRYTSDIFSLVYHLIKNYKIVILKYYNDKLMSLILLR